MLPRVAIMFKNVDNKFLKFNIASSPILIVSRLASGETDRLINYPDRFRVADAVPSEGSHRNQAGSLAKAR
jgi:hypothetical protein